MEMLELKSESKTVWRCSIAEWREREKTRRKKDQK
jgi:hypothetical protein